MATLPVPECCRECVFFRPSDGRLGGGACYHDVVIFGGRHVWDVMDGCGDPITRDWILSTTENGADWLSAIEHDIQGVIE